MHKIHLGSAVFLAKKVAALVKQKWTTIGLF